MQLKTFVNDELKQNGNTSDMIFPVTDIISYISQIMTLNPGDVILTGTPQGIGQLQHGDKVCVEIENIGRLENMVKNAS